MRAVDQETVLFEGHCASIFVGRQRRRKALGDPAGQAMATTELEVMARVGTATPAVQSDDVVCCKNLRCTDSYFVAQQQHRVLYMRLWPPTHFGPSWQKTEEKKRISYVRRRLLSAIPHPLTLMVFPAVLSSLSTQTLAFPFWATPGKACPSYNAPPASCCTRPATQTNKTQHSRKVPQVPRVQGPPPTDANPERPPCAESFCGSSNPGPPAPRELRRSTACE